MQIDKRKRIRRMIPVDPLLFCFYAAVVLLRFCYLYLALYVLRG